MPGTRVIYYRWLRPRKRVTKSIDLYTGYTEYSNASYPLRTACPFVCELHEKLIYHVMLIIMAIVVVIIPISQHFLGYWELYMGDVEITLFINGYVKNVINSSYRPAYMQQVYVFFSLKVIDFFK